MKGGQEEKQEGGAERGPCVRMGEKLPCTMWSDLYTGRDVQLTRQSRSKKSHIPTKNANNAHLRTCSCKTNLHLVNYVTNGPYGRGQSAGQMDRIPQQEAEQSLPAPRWAVDRQMRLDEVSNRIIRKTDKQIVDN